MLCLGDLKWLVEELYPVQSKWYDLGLQLEIPPGSLDAIKKDNPETSTAFREMLKQWLTGKEPSLEKLSEALQKVSQETVLFQLPPYLNLQFLQQKLKVYSILPSLHL